MELEKFKRNYLKICKMYKLPSFRELNEAFDIEKIDKESDIFLKQIRKVMMEKIVNILSFVEMLLNPVNSPRMYLSYISGMCSEDKKILGEIYLDFSNLTLISLESEINYTEEREAKIINEIFEIWGKNKKNFMKIVKNIGNPNKSEKKKPRSYFG